MPRGTIEIVEFDPRRLASAAEPSSSLPEYPRADDLLSRLRRRHRALTSGVVAMLVVALHALVLTPVFIGTSAAPTRDQRLGAESVIHALILQDPSIASREGPPSLAPPVLQLMRLEALSTPSLPDEPASAQPSAGDPGLAALYGQYLGQIHARISRAWLRPRTAIGSDIFRCQIEIAQHRDGMVDTVTLQRCNGTIRWQQSLVQAVENASPLPAPVNPAVFVRHVVLRFRALRYTPGAPAELYEPVMPAATADAQKAQDAFMTLDLLRQAPRAATGRSHAHTVITLRIEGDRTRVTPQPEH